MWKHWKTTVTIPELNKKTAKSFMQMIMMVAELAKVPHRAYWAVKSEGNKYTVYAMYKEYPYVPLSERPKIRWNYTS